MIWTRNADGNYTSNLPKYAGYEIRNWGSNTWALFRNGVLLNHRPTLRDAKVLAAYDVNEN